MILRTENLTVSYGPLRVLDGLSLALTAGEITALIGPNGCGKSTLLNCFSRLLTPKSGSVLLENTPLGSFSSRQLARKLALLPQHHLTPEGITVRELVSYGRSPWLSLWGRLSGEDHARVNAAMSQTQTHHLAPGTGKSSLMIPATMIGTEQAMVTRMVNTTLISSIVAASSLDIMSIFKKLGVCGPCGTGAGR
jgi:iron complex transport system ATP-binding protein